MESSPLGSCANRSEKTTTARTAATRVAASSAPSRRRQMRCFTMLLAALGDPMPPLFFLPGLLAKLVNFSSSALLLCSVSDFTSRSSALISVKALPQRSERKPVLQIVCYSTWAVATRGPGTSWSSSPPFSLAPFLYDSSP